MRQNTATSARRQPYTIECQIMSSRHARAFVSDHHDAGKRTVTVHLPPARRLTKEEGKEVLAEYRMFMS